MAIIFLCISCVSAIELDDTNSSQLNGQMHGLDEKNSSINTDIDDFNNLMSSDAGSFEELSIKISNTPDGGALTLDKDYKYLNGSNKGILISKSITIDGAGHSLNGNKLSRMFNITSDNVVLKNINFVNGNAYGRYGGIAGGGAIYWSGANGILENCNFTNNSGSGIEDDPFDKEETIVNDDGSIIHMIRIRPMGAKINEGGAIVWNGTNGLVSNCIFTHNIVGYPNSGGAICWRGNDGRILNSKFYENSAWCGAAVCWIGDNGKVLSCVMINNSFMDGGMYWFGKNGVVKNSILISSSFRSALCPSDCDVDANYNFWGDTIENPNTAIKPNKVSNWLVMRFSHNGEFINEGDNIIIDYDITTLIDKNGKLSQYYELINYSSQISFTANKDGFIKGTFENGEPKIVVDSKDTIKSKNLVKYYTKKTSFTVKVSDFRGKVVGKQVKFRINKKNYYATTNKKGQATLKINLKPGKYNIYSYYGDAKVKNRITIKPTLITKNVFKKVKRSAKFKVKVLNSKGKIQSKKIVKIKFKGKTYKIKTNKKGIATFKLPWNLKVGKYTIKTIYGGQTNSNKIIVKK